MYKYSIIYIIRRGCDSLDAYEESTLQYLKVFLDANIDEINRAVASLTVPGGQEFHFPHFLLKFQSIFLIFPQTLLIFFLTLALRVGEYATGN